VQCATGVSDVWVQYTTNKMQYALDCYIVFVQKHSKT
jgi:hypothetical protein